MSTLLASLIVCVITIIASYVVASLVLSVKLRDKECEFAEERVRLRAKVRKEEKAIFRDMLRGIREDTAKILRDKKAEIQMLKQTLSGRV